MWVKNRTVDDMGKIWSILDVKTKGALGGE
jgi:hypothetical protein